MSKIHFEDKNKSRFSKRAGMYISLAVCMIALGIGSWSAVKRANDLNQEAQLPSTTNSALDARVNETDVTQIITKASETQVKTTQSTTKKSATFFTVPVVGNVIKSFSDTELQYSETYNDWRLHTAVDIAVEKGTKVYCSGNGTVADIYDDERYGTTVIIDHGNNIVTEYSCVSTPCVQKGQSVEVGDMLGTVGDIECESVEQAHLHFAAKRDGKYVDPYTALSISTN